MAKAIYTVFCVHVDGDVVSGLGACQPVVLMYTLWRQDQTLYLSIPKVSPNSMFTVLQYVSLMYALKKKLERYLRVNLLGPGPRLMKKEFTGPRSHEG